MKAGKINRRIATAVGVARAPNPNNLVTCMAPLYTFSAHGSAFNPVYNSAQTRELKQNLRSFARRRHREGAEAHFSIQLLTKKRPLADFLPANIKALINPFEASRHVLRGKYVQKK